MKKAVIFIHGLGGSNEKTWLVPSGEKYGLNEYNKEVGRNSLLYYLKKEKEFNDNDYDFFTFEYKTSIIPFVKIDSLNEIEKITAELNKYLNAISSKYKDISIIAHSLGGLIALDVAQDIKLDRIITLGTPFNGHTLADILRKNQIILNMKEESEECSEEEKYIRIKLIKKLGVFAKSFTADVNKLNPFIRNKHIRFLSTDPKKQEETDSKKREKIVKSFKEMKTKPSVYCGFETDTFAGVFKVDFENATELADESIPLCGTHLDITKIQGEPEYSPVLSWIKYRLLQRNIVAPNSKINEFLKDTKHSEMKKRIIISEIAYQKSKNLENHMNGSITNINPVNIDEVIKSLKSELCGSIQ